MIRSPPLYPNKSGIIVNVMEKWNHYITSFPGLNAVQHILDCQGEQEETQWGAAHSYAYADAHKYLYQESQVLVLVHRYPELSVLAFEKSGT